MEDTNKHPHPVIVLEGGSPPQAVEVRVAEETAEVWIGVPVMNPLSPILHFPKHSWHLLRTIEE